MDALLEPGELGDSVIAELSAALDKTGQTPMLVGPDSAKIELPVELYELLRGIVGQLKIGNGVAVLPLHAELTTAETAQFLNVSRPHVVKLLEQGALAFTMAGTHRRVRLVDLVDYRESLDVKRQAALAEIQEMGDEDGMEL